MQIAGLQKTTLVDYPGKVAATVFLRGCNFRCGFCHNPEIVLPEHFEGTMPEEEFFRFLESRLGKIQGVCITGGEPLLWKDTDNFISHIKALGFAVKLDTNGSYPERLESIIKDGDLDYIAMDIKSSLPKYARTISNNQLSISNRSPQIEKFPLENSLKIAPEGSSEKFPLENSKCNISQEVKLIENINKSIGLIMDSGIDYEFRTTVVNPLHHPDDFAHIGEMIKGAKKYFIQNFVQSKHIDSDTVYTPFSEQQLATAQALVAPFVGTVEIR